MTVHQLSLSSSPRLPAVESVLAKIGRGVAAGDLEGQQLDFKEPASSAKETFALLAGAAVCFANAEGGRIVLGVKDDATSRLAALVGVPLDYSIEIVQRAVFDRTTPPLTLVVNEHSEDGARLLIIDVPPGVMIHSTNDGRATRRLGKECRPFTPAQQRELLVARGQFDWSNESSGVPPRQLSRAEIDRLRDLLATADADDLAALRDRPLLEALRLLGADGFVTNAGLLLLGREPDVREVIPTYGYSYQYRPSPGSEATHRLRGHRGLLAAVEVLMEAIEARTEIRPLNIEGGVQLQLADYPANAVRELVVNALIHRSYEATGSVDIEHSPERLVITSPGALVAGVTPENILTHPSTPRHRVLLEAVARCQLAERTGQGIDRAYREMLRVGKPPPEIEDLGTRVRAVLPGGIGNDDFVRFVTQLPEKLRRDVEVLICLTLFRAKPRFDSHTLATSIQRSPIEAQEVLARLADDRLGLLEPTRRTLNRQFPTYQLRNKPLADLARAVSYRRRFLDEGDAKIVEHVHEYGYVTNKTLQRLFDVDLYASRNMLTDLRNRGILAKIGDARGGPGVRYGPGPKFPKSKSSKTS
jgi:ATP-dependent DNA helicase RecG